MSPDTPRFPRVILATCLVPWREDGTWDEPRLRGCIEDLVTHVTPHLYLFGTAGEGYAVTDDQFRAVTRCFTTTMASLGAFPMVGVIGTSLGSVQERIAFARDLGVTAFQISFPSWGALLPAEVDAFFAHLCDRFPDVRFLHYNLARAQPVLTGRDYARLAARHPNLVAVKMGGESLDTLADVARAAPALRCFFTEFAYLRLADTCGCGLLSALSACSPRLPAWIFEAPRERAPEAEALLRAVHAAVKQAMEGRTVIDGAYDKLYARLVWPDFSLRLAPPYVGASEAGFQRFRETVSGLLSDASLSPP
ncbi:MAG: dihydrodipicolinate synthase family protein [Opitutaceae bacterium]|nr:dihydrodipicolinate synthase family protein [Opitutaceae bacterium]